MFGSAHAQVASAYGGALPPPAPPSTAGLAVAKAGAKSRGSRSVDSRSRRGS